MKKLKSAEDNNKKKALQKVSCFAKMGNGISFGEKQKITNEFISSGRK